MSKLSLSLAPSFKASPVSVKKVGGLSFIRIGARRVTYFKAKDSSLSVNKVGATVYVQVGSHSFAIARAKPQTISARRVKLAIR